MKRKQEKMKKDFKKILKFFRKKKSQNTQSFFEK